MTARERSTPGARLCELCGHGNEESATACAVCGNELPVVARPLAERIGWVCDACDAWNVEGSTRCSFCGEPLGALSAVPTPGKAAVTAAFAAEIADEPTAAATAPPPPESRDEDSTTQTPMAVGGQLCAACGTPAIPNNRFCGNCGAPLSLPTAASAHATGGLPARAAATKAELVLVQTDGTDGARFSVGASPQTAGRTEGAILFPDDRLLSGRHATLWVEAGHLIVEDLGSTNGTFVRIAAPHPLIGDDVILLGEQLLLFRHPISVPAVHPDSSGTVPYVSSPAPAAFHLVQIMAGGRSGTVYTPMATRVTIGREASDISFPTDRFMSSRHARIEPTGGGYQIVDLQSRNGTYVRIRARATVRPGETVFLGQQLFRFVLSPTV